MGCTTVENLHRFPLNPARRAEWCRILGVYSRVKRLYACTAHFRPCDIFRNRTSKFAIPKPPAWRTSNPKIMAMGNSTSDSVPNSYIQQSSISENISENVLEENETVKDSKTEKSQENFGKLEDFEIRKGNTNDMILKGRCIQTNDYLIVSYTPPRKWSLQQQLKILDGKCLQQLKQIKELSTENQRLYRELRKQEKLLPVLRHLRSERIYLHAQLKMYKLKEKELRKCLKQKRVKRCHDET